MQGIHVVSLSGVNNGGGGSSRRDNMISIDHHMWLERYMLIIINRQRYWDCKKILLDDGCMSWDMMDVRSSTDYFSTKHKESYSNKVLDYRCCGYDHCIIHK